MSVGSSVAPGALVSLRKGHCNMYLRKLASYEYNEDEYNEECVAESDVMIVLSVERARDRDADVRDVIVMTRSGAFGKILLYLVEEI